MGRLETALVIGLLLVGVSLVTLGAADVRAGSPGTSAPAVEDAPPDTEGTAAAQAAGAKGDAGESASDRTEPRFDWHPVTSAFEWLRSHQAYAVALVVALAVIVVGYGFLLYHAGKTPGKPLQIPTLSASFFFWLGMTYSVLLLLMAVFYNLTWKGPRPYLFSDLLPVGVPWFGAVGAVTISLEGVFLHGHEGWNTRFNYWHLARPVFGAVLGIVAFFVFLLITSSAGTPPPFLNEPGKAKQADFIVYYVVAFLVGYRDETFRELIKRVTDMLLKPVTPENLPSLAFRKNGEPLPSLDFESNAVDPRPAPLETVQVTNTGNAALAAPRVAFAGSGKVFAMTRDDVSGTQELRPGETREVEVTFNPTEFSEYTDTLTVSGTNLPTAATLRITGRASKPQSGREGITSRSSTGG